MSERIFKSKTVFLIALLCFSAAAAFSQTYSRKQTNRRPKTNFETNYNRNFDTDERQIFELVNRERAKQNLNELEWRADLAQLARNYSEKMAQDDFFSHFEANGASVVERARAMKIKHWSKIGENLFECENLNAFDSFAVEKWMESETHRENILDESWTAAGIGIAQSNDGRIYITQVFIKK